MKVRLLAASPLLLILWLGGMPSVSARQADPPSRWYGNVGLTAGYFDRIIKDEDEDIPSTPCSTCGAKRRCCWVTALPGSPFPPK